MLVAYQFSLAGAKQIVIAGDKDAPDTQALIQTLQARFVPFKVALLSDAAAMIPAVAPMGPVDGRAAAYVCQNYTCQLPVSEPEKLDKLLQ